MQIKMLGHACLICKTEDASILMDPWLSGPANFRSWWHFPEVRGDLGALPKLDYLYVSHLHDDHFHLATLRQLSQRPVVLVPRLYHNRLVRQLRHLGYHSIIELPHGKTVKLEGSTWVSCVQMGNDSMLVVGDSSATMLNANDALQGNDPTITMPLLGRWRISIHSISRSWLLARPAVPMGKRSWAVDSIFNSPLEAGAIL
jgi:L-ascorbate metabolism protein UlaG (beta-lactamase superfamily)